MKENVDKYKISGFAIVGKEKIKRKTKKSSLFRKKKEAIIKEKREIKK